MLFRSAMGRMSADTREELPDRLDEIDEFRMMLRTGHNLPLTMQANLLPACQHYLECLVKLPENELRARYPRP